MNTKEEILNNSGVELIIDHKLDEALKPVEEKKQKDNYILLSKEIKRISDLKKEVEQDLQDALSDDRGVEMVQVLKSIISKLGDSLISIDRQKSRLKK